MCRIVRKEKTKLLWLNSKDNASEKNNILVDNITCTLRCYRHQKFLA